MKILFAFPKRETSPVQGLGRHLLLLAQSLEKRGHNCDWFMRTNVPEGEDAVNALNAFLASRKGVYDLVDYDLSMPGFMPHEAEPSPVYVARAFLLIHQFASCCLPESKDSLLAKLKLLLRGRQGPLRGQRLEQEIQKVNHCLRQADLLHVLNSDDVKLLTQHGFPGEKVFQLPCALTQQTIEALKQCQSGGDKPVVSFLGTFDSRKGAEEMPAIAEFLASRHSHLELRLIGTGGALADEASVLRSFPRKLHPHIKVIPSFEPQQLSELLSGVTCGVFPSYLEGSPLGVLEQLAAGLPVAGYRAPGTADILPEAWMSKPGDWRQLATILDNWLTQGVSPQMQDDARSRGSRYTWDDIARLTETRYLELIAARND